MKREINSLTDRRLVRIDPTTEGFFDNFHKACQLVHSDEVRILFEDVYHFVEPRVKVGILKPFWKPIYEPSYDDGKIVFNKKLPPAVGYPIIWWRKETAKLPTVEGKSWKVGTNIQYLTFLVWLINRLVDDSGWDLAEALKAILDSKVFGRFGYYNLEEKLILRHSSAGKEFGGVFDLTNTRKILFDDDFEGIAWLTDEERDKWETPCWLVGPGDWFNYGSIATMRECYYDPYYTNVYQQLAVCWLVID